jgi:signal peptidase I
MNMFNFKNKRIAQAREYEQVNVNPFVKGMIQAAVTLIDIAIMFMLIWHTFAYIIPVGSWINFVNGDSMDPTLHSGQIMYTEMAPIDRGDIVTACFPESALEQHPEYKDQFQYVIKRVIGVPGDRIIINEDGIFINGELLVEDYLIEENKKATLINNGYNSVLLDTDEYFLLGDNRQVSYDSRYFGVFKADEILYEQSTVPNSNFWLKLIFVLLIFALDIFLYALVEYILTECAYVMFRKNKTKNTSVNHSDNADNNNINNN